jgi:hypothetical protein
LSQHAVSDNTSSEVTSFFHSWVSLSLKSVFTGLRGTPMSAV